MTDFKFTELVNDPHRHIITTALGPNSSTKFADNDIGKMVKIGLVDNYILAVAGDEIEGFVTSVEPATVKDGFSMGGILTNMRKEVEIDVAIDGTATNEAVVVGEFAIVGTQAALGTAETTGLPQVRDGANTVHLWRFIRVDGDGLAGSTALVERV